MKKTLLITGVKGFIGKALFRYAKENMASTYNVVGIDKKGGRESSQYLVCDCNHFRSLKAVLNKVRPDVIFHMVGGRFPTKSLTHQINVGISEKLFKAIKAIDDFDPKVIVPGSAAEYGEIKKMVELVSEKYKPQPTHYYGAIKLLQTQLSLNCAKEGLDVVVLRLFNVIGPKIPATFFPGKIANRIAIIKKDGKSPLIELGNLGASRDYIDIEDVCRAFFAAVDRGKSGVVYNVCSGRKTAIRALLKKMVTAAGDNRIKIVEDKSSSSMSFDIVGSNELLKKQTGWTPSISLNESIKRVLQ